jgi:hypothetical protein
VFYPPDRLGKTKMQILTILTQIAIPTFVVAIFAMSIGWIRNW